MVCSCMYTRYEWEGLGGWGWFANGQQGQSVGFIYKGYEWEGLGGWGGWGWVANDQQGQSIRIIYDGGGNYYWQQRQQRWCSGWGSCVWNRMQRVLANLALCFDFFQYFSKFSQAIPAWSQYSQHAAMCNRYSERQTVIDTGPQEAIFKWNGHRIPVQLYAHVRRCIFCPAKPQNILCFSIAKPRGLNRTTYN